MSRLVAFTASRLSKTLMSCSLIAMLMAAGIAQAETATRQHGHHQNVVSRQTQQQKTENGFTRTTTKTNASGATATRNTIVVNDKDAGTRTRTVSGTNFKGETYSGESVAQKTANGYTVQKEFTNANGKTTERSVNAVVDESAGTVTKNISTTHVNGETTTKTVVKPLPKHK